MPSEIISLHLVLLKAGIFSLPDSLRDSLPDRIIIGIFAAGKKVLLSVSLPPPPIIRGSKVFGGRIINRISRS